MALSNGNFPYTFGFIDQLVRINFPQAANFLIGGDVGTFPGDNEAYIDGSVNGVNWATVAIPSATTIGSLAAVGNTWIATTDTGLWRSADGAKTWKLVQAGDFSLATVAGKTFPKETKATFIVGIRSNSQPAWVSKDAGLTWSTVSFGDPDNENLLFCVAAGSYIFIAVALASGDTDLLGVIYSTTDGTTWTRSTVFNDIPTSTFLQVYIRGIAFNKGKYSVCASTLTTVQQEGPFGPGDTSLRKLATAAGTGTSWGGSVTYGDGGIDFGFGSSSAIDTIIMPPSRTNSFVAAAPGGPLMAAGKDVFALIAVRQVGPNDGAPITVSQLVGTSTDGETYSFGTTLNEVVVIGGAPNFGALSCIGFNGTNFVVGAMEGSPGDFYSGEIATPAYYYSSDTLTWIKVESTFPAPPSVNGVWCIGVGQVNGLP